MPSSVRYLGTQPAIVISTESASRNSIRNIWGERTAYSGEEWPLRVDERVLEEPERWVPSACVLCANGCGMDIGVKDGRIVGVRGRNDRTNRGRLGPKGLHGWEANASAERLKSPLVRHNKRFAKASWDDAMGRIVRRSQQLLNAHGPGAIAFYSSGQLFLEEYYTLALIGKAGIGTPHMDANTRLCTATADTALRESFACDGQPASFDDVDTASAIFLVGQNPAETQTVFWMRILDRLASANPPSLIVADPRLTPTAELATVHLAPRLGTNVALLNGILHLVIKHEWYDKDYVARHAVGFDDLARTVEGWPPERAAEVCDIAVRDLEEAAELIGTAPRLVSTVLQGVYQSMQATAAACQVNNLHIIRAMLGKPGCGVFQMNGQPTSENTRETGADGEMPAFRNLNNEAHMRDLAAIWNVPAEKIPHWSEPTHIMQILRYCEEGSIKMLWIAGTNPAVSLPDLARIRRVLQHPDLFVVVQDGFMTETAELADVVLPTAIWGEKTGTYTNADRTCHLSLKAIDPPGESRSDLDVWLDYARRMDFRDKDGAPLVKWSDPEAAFEAWKACSKGRPCDYSGMSYEKLRSGGIQWPCNEQHPEGTARLYEDGHFFSAVEECESFGHDLVTGALSPQEKYAAHDPRGKAILKSAEYEAPVEEPDDEFPFWLTTGRVVYHFHTRTKTARAKELEDAAPEVFVEMNEDDGRRLHIGDNDRVAVRSRRGTVYAKARLSGIKPGHVFLPFHYGNFDGASNTAANELTITTWDPVSKQPSVKFAAVALRKA